MDIRKKIYVLLYYFIYSKYCPQQDYSSIHLML